LQVFCQFLADRWEISCNNTLKGGKFLAMGGKFLAKK